MVAGRSTGLRAGLWVGAGLAAGFFKEHLGGPAWVAVEPDLQGPPR